MIRRNQMEAAQNEGEDGGGSQLALSIDLAPPKLSPTQPDEGRHLIELSLCVQQQQHQSTSLIDPATGDHNEPIDDEPQNQRGDSGDNVRPAQLAVGSDAQTSSPGTKRRLIYERIDRFSLELSSSSIGESKKQQQQHLLPFKSATFDACFCFNLLNLQVGATSATELDEAEKRTSELRLALLAELARVVKSKGKIMVTVFAYECQRRQSSSISENSRQQQQQPSGCGITTAPVQSARRRNSRRSSMSQQQQQQLVVSTSTTATSNSSNNINNYSADPMLKETEDFQAEDNCESCCPRCRLEYKRQRDTTQSIESRRQSAAEQISGPSATSRNVVTCNAPSNSNPLHQSSGSRILIRPKADVTTACDTIQKLIERTQFGSSDSQATGKLMHKTHLPANQAPQTESTRAGRKSDKKQPDPGRRHSMSIWQRATSVATSNDNLPALSEAAKRFGRRLSSLGGSTLMSLLNPATKPPASNQPAATETREEEGEETPSAQIKHHVCDIRFEEVKTDETESGNDQEMSGTGGCSEGQQLHMMSNVMDLFDDVEFAKRHRQSIAVQTFFTKSIEVQEESEGDNAAFDTEEVQNDCTEATNIDDNGDSKESNKQLVVADEFQGENETVRRQQSEQSEANEEEEEEELTANDDTTSGWTAPTSYGLESSLNQLTPQQHQQPNSAPARAPNGDDRWQIQAQRQRVTDKSQVSGFSAIDNGCASFQSANINQQQQQQRQQDENSPHHQVLASDFSSFTLADTTTIDSGSDSRKQHQPQVAGSLELHGRGAMNSQECAAEGQQQQQRRAFSETEASSMQKNQLSEKCHGGLVRLSGNRTSGSGLPSNLIGCGNPADIGTNQSAGGFLSSAPSGIRQIRSAEPTRCYNSPLANNSTSTTSSSGGQKPHYRGLVQRGETATQQHAHTRDRQAVGRTGREQEIGAGYSAVARHHQQRQWCESNTFSSSLNSDISTSGGGGPKDTTEKDSSRRTSTLSGISSIYQQEISLGLNTPHGGPFGGSSTPNNSPQVATVSGSNMGSIPELASVENSPCAQGGNPDLPHLRDTGASNFCNRTPNNDAQDPIQSGSGDYMSGANNIQRVAQSLRSQLRERLTTTMRPLNALINKTSGAADGHLLIQEESVGDIEAAKSSESLTPTSMQKQQGEVSPQNRQNAGHLSATHVIPATGSSQPNTGKMMDRSDTRQHSPATLKAFFRSTSSAAFNAFASSFNQPGAQYPSSSSTPTGTTMRAAASGAGPGYLSSNSSQLFGASGSVSSDVFDNGGNTTTTSTPVANRFNLFGFSNNNNNNNNSTAENSPNPLLVTTPGAEPTSPGSVDLTARDLQRSPMSPVSSVTSTRFFAKIRDMFSLSPAAGTTHAANSPASQQSSNSPLQTPQVRTDAGLRQHQQQQDTDSAQSRPSSVDTNSVNANINDYYDDYERVISSRRPSLQRQLDEQVNQVYREAVERKLQNSPIADHCDFGFSMKQLEGTTAPKFIGQQNQQQTVRQIKRLLPSNSDLDSIIKPAAGPLLYNHPPTSIYLPQNSSYFNPHYQEANYTNSGANQLQQQQMWMDSSQQSIESSSSARSLRSCWFSMPELYAMNRDSSSQSPSGIGAANNLCAETQQQLQQPVNELLGSLTQKLTQAAGEQANEWPSNQLYKQVASEGLQDANWSLSDLNLTSDDIAPPKQPEIVTLPPAKQLDAAKEMPKHRDLAELAKNNTLDDSVCVSIKTNSTEDAKGQSDSRPTSQNSTISNASCALSDLSASGLPEQQQQHPQGDATRWLSQDPGANAPADFGKLITPTISKQRAMSLVPSLASELQPQVIEPTSNQFLTAAQAAAPRRRSAMGNLLSHDPNVAPAAATLDLRLAARKNRVKLTDLHPITFMNDRKFLNSMNSIKKSNNKLDAIFNSPVGRRLSINAAETTPLTSNGKSGIKIGLTGYVYLDPGLQTGPNATSNFIPARRPSLAPNFWRQQPRTLITSDNQGTGTGQQQLASSPLLSPGDAMTLRRPRAASCTPNSLRSDFTTDLKSDSPPTGAPSEHTNYRQLSPSLLNHLPSERRRSTLSLLERLSESSIELPTDPKTESSEESPTNLNKTNNNPPATCSNDVLPTPRSSQRRSVSSLLKIGEDEELKPSLPVRVRQPPSPKIARPVGQNRPSSATSPNSAAEERRRRQRRRANSKNSSSSRSNSSESIDDESDTGRDNRSTSSSSSDDGDLDKLIAQYSVVGEPQWLPPSQSQPSGPLKNHRRPLFEEERVVKNDMILKQLLLASLDHQSTNTQSPGSRFSPSRGFERRASAINLYQRDEDVFVANSMRRPPTNQIQVLNVLAGTLPVLPHPLKQAKNPRAGMKSIISGTSGLSNAPAGYHSPERETAPQKSTNLASAISLAGEVDVEEQLNRLRLQERRMQAKQPESNQQQELPVESQNDSELGTPPNGESVKSTSSSESHESLLSDKLELDLGEVSVPNDLSTIPAILQPPGEQNKPNNSQPRSPPHSPTSTIVTCLSNLSGRSIPSDSTGAQQPSYSSSGSKSCEPFKQLDTIIEGRGLLLGAEQHANANYANRLRRLSGNHSRRSSLGTTSQRDQLDQSDEWCKCDPSPAKRRSSSIVNPTLPQTSATQQIAQSSSIYDEKRSSVQRNDLSTTKYNTPLNETQNNSRPSMFDTVRSLARRTLDNLGATSTLLGGSQSATSAADIQGRQLRSSSVAVMTSRPALSRASGQWEQPTLPSSRLLERKKAEHLAKRARSETGSVDERADGEEQEDIECPPSSSSSTSASSSSSSLNSLDDAENYRTKNKENKMKHGRSLESSSSESGPSSASQSSTTSSADSVSDTDQVEVEVRGEALKDEDEIEEPKICYKCNKRIRIEHAGAYFEGENTEDFEDEEEDFVDDEDFEDEEAGDEEEDVGDEADDVGDDDDDGVTKIDTKSKKLSELRQQRLHQQQHRQNNAPARTGTNSGNLHRVARGRPGARRTASMNAPSANSNTSSAGVHCQRRKNKWHIQRNLAPKLKRQRSFSANYAPEVPNPMMPPPRRFSAAPTLTCPHRNKSSPHSSSSLYHTYSIDSSESMITVIPANRGGHEFKRTSRGSLSCNSGQDGASSGSLYALPRSPLSPRSPSRCSPGLLTPNASESFHPFGTSAASSTTCLVSASTSGYTLSKDATRPGGSPSALHGSALEEPRRKSTTCERQLNLPTPMDRAHRGHSLSASDLVPSNQFLDLSLAPRAQMLTNRECLQSPKADDGNVSSEEFCLFNVQQNKQDGDLDEKTCSGKPRGSIINETINNFCARHSKEEMNFLVDKLGGNLKISDSYFSNRSSTLCMIIEVATER